MESRKKGNGESEAQEGRLCWASIWGGVLSSTGLGILFGLLGVGLGLMLLTPEGPDDFSGLGTGGLIWVMTTGTVAMFLCGWVAAYFSCKASMVKGILHGVVAWALATVLGVVAVGSGAGMLIVGAGQLVGEGLSMATKSVSTAAPLFMDKTLADQVDRLLSGKNSKPPTGDVVDDLMNAKEEIGPSMIEAVKSYLMDTEEGKTEELKQKALNILVKNTTLTQDQSLKLLRSWKDRANETKNKALEGLKVVNDMLIKTSLMAFFTLLLGFFSTMAGSVSAIMILRNNVTEVRSIKGGQQ